MKLEAAILGIQEEIARHELYVKEHGWMGPTPAHIRAGQERLSELFALQRLQRELRQETLTFLDNASVAGAAHRAVQRAFEYMLIKEGLDP